MPPDEEPEAVRQARAAITAADERFDRKINDTRDRHRQEVADLWDRQDRERRALLDERERELAALRATLVRLLRDAQREQP